MGYALMRIETIIERLLRAPADLAPPQLTADLGAVRLGLESALAELRTISAGLQLPDLGPLSTREIAERAVRDFQRKTGASVDLAVTGEAGETALPVKIALYRLLQESLANGFRHADGIDLRVALTHDDGFLAVRISDGGPGFEPGTQAQAGHLGMTGMRERVESLGGVFELDAAAGRGTRITARMPLQVPGAGDE
jgi:signal transduction histidine kinase